MANLFCRSCGVEVTGRSVICPNCGRCPNCGMKLRADARECSACNWPFHPSAIFRIGAQSAPLAITYEPDLHIMSADSVEAHGSAHYDRDSPQWYKPHGRDGAAARGRRRRSIVRWEVALLPWIPAALILFILLLMWPQTPGALLASPFGRWFLQKTGGVDIYMPLYCTAIILILVVVMCVLALAYEFTTWALWTFLGAAGFAIMTCFLFPLASYGLYFMTAATVILLVDSFCQLRFWEGIVFSFLAGVCTLLQCINILDLEAAKILWR